MNCVLCHGLQSLSTGTYLPSMPFLQTRNCRALDQLMLDSILDEGASIKSCRLNKELCWLSCTAVSPDWEKLLCTFRRGAFLILMLSQRAETLDVYKNMFRLLLQRRAHIACAMAAVWVHFQSANVARSSDLPPACVWSFPAQSVMRLSYRTAPKSLYPERASPITKLPPKLLCSCNTLLKASAFILVMLTDLHFSLYIQSAAAG